MFPWSRVSGASDGDVRYIYLGEHQPVIWSTGLPMDDGDYEIDIIDTWTMKITPGEKIRDTAVASDTARQRDPRPQA